MQNAMARYIEQGIEGGSFLNAVLCNDLLAAIGNGDEINRARIFDYAAFLYNEALRDCYGSPEKVNQWIAKGGLQSLAA